VTVAAAGIVLDVAGGCLTDNFDRVGSGWSGGPIPWTSESSEPSGSPVYGTDGSRAYVTATATSGGTGFVTAEHRAKWVQAFELPLEFSGVSEFEHGPDVGGPSRTGGDGRVIVGYLADDAGGYYVDVEVTLYRNGATAGPGTTPQRIAADVFIDVWDAAFTTNLESQTVGTPSGWYPADWGTSQIPIAWRARFTGTKVMFRAWAASGPEPELWDFVATYENPAIVAAAAADPAAYRIFRMQTAELKSSWTDDLTICAPVAVEPGLVDAVDFPSTFAGVRMRNQLSATSKGGATSTENVFPTGTPGPKVVGTTGSLAASWIGFGSITGATMGTQEQEERRWLVYAVPPEATAIRLHGYAQAVNALVMGASDGRPQETTVEYQMGPITWDGITDPDWDNIGSGLGGSTPVHDDEFTAQVKTPIDLVVTALGPPLDWLGDYPADWKSFAISIANVSENAIGQRTTFGLGTPADGVHVVVDGRFPNQGNWDLASVPGNDQDDWTETYSSVVVSLQVTALVDDAEAGGPGGTGGSGSLEGLEVFVGSAHIGRSLHA